MHGDSLTMASVGQPVEALAEVNPADASQRDPHVNPLGVKGVGELAMVGVAPAITNAIYHAAW